MTQHRVSVLRPFKLEAVCRRVACLPRLHLPPPPLCFYLPVVPLQIRQIRKKMMEIITREATSCDLKDLVAKLIPEAIGKEIEKSCHGIYPLQVGWGLICQRKGLQPRVGDPQVLGARALGRKREYCRCCAVEKISWEKVGGATV